MLKDPEQRDTRPWAWLESLPYDHSAPWWWVRDSKEENESPSTRLVLHSFSTMLSSLANRHLWPHWWLHQRFFFHGMVKGFHFIIHWWLGSGHQGNAICSQDLANCKTHEENASFLYCWCSFSLWKIKNKGPYNVKHNMIYPSLNSQRLFGNRVLEGLIKLEILDKFID